MEYVDFWMAGCPLTLMPPEIVVRFGDPVSVNCTTSETDAQGMGWEAPFGGTGFEQGPTVTWMVERLENWYILAKCYITRNNGDQCQVMPSITLYSEYKPTDCTIHYLLSLSCWDYSPKCLI